MSTVVARRIAEPEPTVAEFHRVRKGETISRIAVRYHLSQRQLRAWNRLGTTSRIRAGQRLRISAPATQRASRAAGKVATRKVTTHVTRLAGTAGAVPPARGHAVRSHTVRKGETLSGLARR